MPVRLTGLGTAVPEHRADQAELRALARALFPRYGESRRHLEVFDHAGIETRYLAMPPEWYTQPHGFPEKNAQYVRNALLLSLRAAREALALAACSPAQVDALVFVSTTGIATPSLDAAIIGELGLGAHTVRMPLWGLGCAGGAAGLARAADLVRAGYRRVLLVAAELCSLTFVREDYSKSNFVGSALFADGAAAVLLEGGEGPGLRLMGHHSTLIEHSADVMGWDLAEDGLRVRFSRDIPALVRELMRENVAQAAASLRWCREDLRHFVVHPGGVKVLSAFEEALEMGEGGLRASRAVLREYGNMSSPSVLFVLRRCLEARPAPGRGLLTAMGPGFSAEHVLFEVP
nr:chalcone synthase [Deinobacterium chartae]